MLQPTNPDVVLAYMGLPLQIFGKVSHVFAFCGIKIILTHTGKHVWAVYTVAATGLARRSWDQIVCGGIDEFVTPPAKGSL
jgi:hypothetical protein